MTQDVNRTIVPLDLEVAMIWGQPLIEDGVDRYRARFYSEAPGFLFPPESGITVDLNLHFDTPWRERRNGGLLPRDDNT